LKKIAENSKITFAKEEKYIVEEVENGRLGFIKNW
jgi:hypothetical protein